PWGRAAAALHVAEHGHARLVAGALLDLARERRADTALRQAHVPELVDVAGVTGALELVPLGHDDDGEVLPALVAPADVVARLVDRDRLLGDQDHVRTAGDPAHHGNPTGVAPHHLDDHHAVVRLGRRVQPVDRLGCDPPRSVEPERA